LEERITNKSYKVLDIRMIMTIFYL
jgi:hypothetical protein